MAGEPEVKGLQEWMYVIIVGALALYLVIGVITWAWMILTGVSAPGAFTASLTAIIGAMAGILSPLRAPGSAARTPEVPSAPPAPPAS